MDSFSTIFSLMLAMIATLVAVATFYFSFVYKKGKFHLVVTNDRIDHPPYHPRISLVNGGKTVVSILTAEIAFQVNRNKPDALITLIYFGAHEYTKKLESTISPGNTLTCDVEFDVPFHEELRMNFQEYEYESKWRTIDLVLVLGWTDTTGHRLKGIFQLANLTINEEGAVVATDYSREMLDVYKTSWCE